MKPISNVTAIPLGIPTSVKPYLGTPSVVESLVRGVIGDVMSLRRRQLEGNQVDLRQQFTLLGLKLQDTFYGRDESFEPFHWNQPSQLGRSIARDAGLGGAEEDAVMRLAAKMIEEFVPHYLQFEAQKLSDSEFRASVDALVSRYRDILLGLPGDKPQV